MLEEGNFLTTYYNGIAQRLQLEIDHLNKLITHKGERGLANEKSLSNLLVKFLPKRYSIGTGIIIDKHGNSIPINIISYNGIC